MGYSNLEVLDKIDGKGLVIDPDNVFWALFNRRHDDGAMPQKKLLSFYKNMKPRLDNQMREFRFGTDMTALYIDPTDRCNSNCPYCYVPASMRKHGRSMTGRELNLILEKAEDYFKKRKKKAVIIFHASEPLLVKKIIFDAIKRFDNKFKFGLQTNAILMEKKDVKFLKMHGAGVGISLDSSLPSVNNRLRRTWNPGGNFTSAVRAIEMFDGYSGLNVITTITKFNVTGLPDMVRFLHSKKVPCVLFNPLRLTQGSSRPLKPDETKMAKYFMKAVDTAVALSKESGKRIIVGNFANVILAIIAPSARRLMCDISPCGGGRCFLTITASGEMIPCGEFIGLKGFSGGNIFKSSIRNALKSRPFRKIRARFVEKMERCRDCVLRNICGAPCPAELHSLGDMYAPSVFCEFYKAVIKHAFKLISQGKEKYCLREEGLNNLQYDYRFF